MEELVDEGLAKNIGVRLVQKRILGYLLTLSYSAMSPVLCS